MRTLVAGLGLLFSLSASVASALPAPAAKALVVCIENNNRSRFLDRFFESFGAEQVARFAARYRRSAIIKDCGYRDLTRALTRFRGGPTDVAILAHGTRIGIKLHDGLMTRRHIRRLAKVTPNLRAVFQLNCWGSHLNAAWRRAGARAVVGAKRVNVRVLAFKNFLEAWTTGKPFDRAIQLASVPANGLQLLFELADRLARAWNRRIDSTFVISGDGKLRF